MATKVVVLVACGAVALVSAVRSRRIVNGLQVLIAKGRKQKRRSALAGNYGPVKSEVYLKECEVVAGKLPAELDGMYLRNGSNPYYEPYASYHWFEGDGMVHATRIKDGKASYCNHFVQTHKLKEEKKAGFPIYAKFGDQEGVRGVFVALLELLKQKTGILRGVPVPEAGNGTANTSLVYHANRLLALHEGDLPYQIKMLCEGVVTTVGRLSVGDGAWSIPFTAHPKLDTTTGNLHIIGYNIDKQPYLQYGVLSSNGSLLKSFPINVAFPSMFHDFAITQNYAVFMHMPLVFDPKIMVQHNTLPVIFKPELPSRIGLLPLTARSGDEIVWYELPSFYVFHIANAWEEDGKVKMYACQADRVDLAAMKFHEDMGSRMTEYIIDPAKGTATHRRISQVVGDFPIVHPARQGKHTRYAYSAVTDTQDETAQIKGIAKFDLDSPRGAKEAAVATIEYDGMRGGEAYFVPRYYGNSKEDADKCNGEDDGFLMVYVYEAATDNSYLHVYDAKTMDPTPLAQVKLPQRVPYGFHTTWVTAQQIREQKLPGLELQK
jgi:carotenoid cleavage dioxygenase